MELLTIVYIATEADLGICMMTALVNVRVACKQFIQALVSICSYKTLVLLCGGSKCLIYFAFCV